MAPVPLDKLSWRDHRAALWWLGLLYRRPKLFCEAVEGLASHRQRLLNAARLMLHALPYLLAVNVAGSLLLEVCGIAGLVSAETIVLRILVRILLGVAGGIALGIGIILMGGRISGVIAVGTAFWSVSGLVGWIMGPVPGGILQGLALGITVGILGGIIGGIPGKNDRGIAEEVALAIVMAMIAGIGAGIAAGITTGIAAGIAAVIAAGIAAAITAIVAGLRAYYHPVARFFIWPHVRANWYGWHPVLWDDRCLLPFRGLDRLLAAFAETDRATAEAEIERLIDNYPSQRRQALRARSRLVARDAARTAQLRDIASIVARLPEGSDGFLAETARVKEWVGEIAALQRQIDVADRPLFRDPLAELLLEKVGNFAHRSAGLHEPLASEFRAAAANWLAIAQRQRDEVRRCRAREPTPQVYRAGDPVNREQEAFVARLGVFGELERQIMLSTGCPGIVLYGRRRTGKSTVLLNLSGFLPATVLPVCVSMQDPKAFTSLASLIELLLGRIRGAFGTAAPAVPASVDLPGLFAFLGAVNERPASDRRRLLIGLDEYEAIDAKIGEGVLPQDLLDTLRESIQSHRSITWMLAESHEITELPHAPWTSVLVSARTIEMPLFTREETTLLLTDPLQHSRFWREKGRQRPRFASAFWGERGIDTIHAEAGGWPHLVQLIAETAIDLSNDGDRRAVDAALLEQALDKATVKGHNVLYELSCRESRLPGEWEYLRGFASRERQPPPADSRIYAALRRRLLLVDDHGECALRVPLMRRWLTQRGWQFDAA